MKRQTYSRSIANAISAYLTNSYWDFTFDKKSGVFRSSLSLKGKIKKIDYLISVRDDDYSVYAISPIGANTNNKTMMDNMTEFVCRANYGLRCGNIELDMRDGEIRAKSYVYCDSCVPTQEIVSYSILSAAAIFESYADGIVGIIFGNLSAKKAIELCEGCDNDVSQYESASLFAEDIDDDLSAKLSRFAARMGSQGFEPVSEKVEESSDNVDHINTNLFTDDGGVA